MSRGAKQGACVNSHSRSSRRPPPVRPRGRCASRMQAGEATVSKQLRSRSTSLPACASAKSTSVGRASRRRDVGPDGGCRRRRRHHRRGCRSEAVEQGHDARQQAHEHCQRRHDLPGRTEMPARQRPERSMRVEVRRPAAVPARSRLRPRPAAPGRRPAEWAAGHRRGCRASSSRRVSGWHARWRATLAAMVTFPEPPCRAPCLPHSRTLRDDPTSGGTDVSDSSSAHLTPRSIQTTKESPEAAGSGRSSVALTLQ